MRASRSLVVLAPLVVSFVLAQSLGCGGTDNDFSRKPAVTGPDDNGPVDRIPRQIGDPEAARVQEAEDLVLTIQKDRPWLQVIGKKRRLVRFG